MCADLASKHLTTRYLGGICPCVHAGNGNSDHIGDKIPLPPVIHLNDGVYEVGRTSPADIRIEVPTVSSRHALLRVGKLARGYFAPAAAGVGVQRAAQRLLRACRQAVQQVRWRYEQTAPQASCKVVARSSSCASVQAQHQYCRHRCASAVCTSLLRQGTWQTDACCCALVCAVEDNKMCITDLNSTNGTVVNGQELSPMDNIEVEVGSEVIFGECLLYHRCSCGQICHIRCL